MKKNHYYFPLLLLFGLSASINSKAQSFNINTYAGNHSSGFSGDGGQATAALMGNPFGVAVDNAGDIYVADPYNQRIRKVNTSGIISTFAGTGGAGFSGDGGQATAAQLSTPNGLGVDGAGNVYITDFSNVRIRKVNSSGVISTVAGNGVTGFSGDGGAATAAELNHVNGNVAIDPAGNLLIPEYGNNDIRMVNTNGIISTVVGNRVQGYSGDGGQATAAELANPYSVILDISGNMFIADDGNNRIRKVSANGIISTVAGNGIAGYSGNGGAATAAELNNPTGVAIDQWGNLYVCEQLNSVIRWVNANGIISTVAGNGSIGFSGDGGPATAAEFSYANIICLDAANNLYVSDQDNYCIRKLSNLETGINEPVGGNNGTEIYPNPGKGEFTIRVKNPSNEILNRIEIYSMLGEKVYSTNTTSANTSIDLSHSGAGMYIYKVLNAKGDIVGSGKFIIQ